MLKRFPGVHLSAVVGVLEADGNERIMAFIEMKPGASLDEARLRAHLAEHPSPYKRPGNIRRIDALPLTANGKILKRALDTAS